MSGSHGPGPGPALLPPLAAQSGGPQDQDRGTAPARGAASPELDGPVIITETASILEMLLSTWQDRTTVLNLVGYLHHQEMAQVRQGLTVQFSYTPPEGLPVRGPVVYNDEVRQTEVMNLEGIAARLAAEPG